MRSTGDIVQYGKEGACTITGMERMDLTGDGKQNYYILEPMFKRGTRVYVEAQDGEAEFREPYRKEDIDKMLAELPETDIKWIDNDRERQEILKKLISEGSISDLIVMVGMLYSKRTERIRNGKKFASADEQYLKRAEAIVNVQLAYSLGVKPDGVPEYIRTRLAEAD